MGEVYIIDGRRTPFLKTRGKPGAFSASDLAVYAGRELLARLPFAPSAFDEVIMGCMIPSPDEANIARVISLRLGCGKKVPAWTVQRNCASGLQALDSAYQNIASGRSHLVLAGGTEAMSRAPILYNERAVRWLSTFMQQKNFFTKLKTMLAFRPNYLIPVISLLRGLTDPVSGYSMGQTAEEIAHRFQVSRDEMDQFAWRSHQRALQAREHGYFAEVMSLFDQQGTVYSEDEGVRSDSTLEKLAKLKPFFDKKYGNVTAGNSSQISDGAALLVLASATAVKKYGLTVLGRIKDTAWAGCEPTQMGLGPTYAIAELLKKNYLTRHDIRFWEINEAFAGQVLACLRAFQDRAFCKEQLDLGEVFGEIRESTLNVDGGAIAIGHPVGASGARLVLHLLQVLRRHDAALGVASLCIGGGQGGAMLIENVTEVTR